MNSITNSIELKQATAIVDDKESGKLSSDFNPSIYFLFGLNETSAYLQVLKRKARIEPEGETTLNCVSSGQFHAVVGTKRFTHYFIFSSIENPEYSWLVKYDKDIFDIERKETDEFIEISFTLKS